MKKILLLALLTNTVAHAELMSEMKFKSHREGEISAGLGWSINKDAIKIIPMWNIATYDYKSINTGISLNIQHKVNDFAVENNLGLDLERVKKKNDLLINTGLSIGFTTDKLSFVGIGNQVRYGFNDNKFFVSPTFTVRASL